MSHSMEDLITTYNQTTNHTAARWEAQPHHKSRSQMRERRLMEKTERESLYAEGR